MTLEEFLTYKPAKDTVDMFFICKAKEIIRKQAQTIAFYAHKDKVPEELKMTSYIITPPGPANARQCQREVEEILK